MAAPATATSSCRSWVVLAVFALGCRAVPTTRTDEGRVPDDVTAEPSRAREWFLVTDAELATVYPLRARIIRGAAVYPERLGKPEGEGAGRTIGVEVVVLDDDAHGDPLRPRVLCESASHRIAVHVDIDDLAAVAREAAVMTATPQNGTGWSGRQPGVRMRAGTTLRVEGGPGGAHVRAHVERPWLRVVGFLPAAYVGHTWVPQSIERVLELADARVREPTAVLVAPGGMELGRIDPRMRAGGVLVRRVGAEQGGFVLVRHDDAEITTVGWVAASALDPATGAPAGATIVGGRAASDPAEPSIELARGTLLRGGALRNPIGVVTQTSRFHCIDACTSNEPRVAVDACATAIGVWAERE